MFHGLLTTEIFLIKTKILPSDKEKILGHIVYRTFVYEYTINFKQKILAAIA